MKTSIRFVMLALSVFSAAPVNAETVPAQNPPPSREEAAAEAAKASKEHAAMAAQRAADYMAIKVQQTGDAIVAAEMSLDQKTRTVGSNLLDAYDQLQRMTADERLAAVDYVIEALDRAAVNIEANSDNLYVFTGVASLVAVASMVAVVRRSPTRVALTLMSSTVAVAAIGSFTHREMYLKQIPRLREHLTSVRRSILNESVVAGAETK